MSVIINTKPGEVYKYQINNVREYYLIIDEYHYKTSTMLSNINTKELIRVKSGNVSQLFTIPPSDRIECIGYINLLQKYKSRFEMILEKII